MSQIQIYIHIETCYAMHLVVANDGGGQVWRCHEYWGRMYGRSRGCGCVGRPLCENEVVIGVCAELLKEHENTSVPGSSAQRKSSSRKDGERSRPCRAMSAGVGNEYGEHTIHSACTSPPSLFVFICRTLMAHPVILAAAYTKCVSMYSSRPRMLLTCACRPGVLWAVA